MFVLDTNVLAELMRRQRVPEIADWIASQDEALLFITAISQAEIFAGLSVMPDGRRRRDLERSARDMFEEFADRVLPFDPAAAVAYADLFARRRAGGRPAATLDLMIAAIARSHNAGVVTRDTSGFVDCDVDVVNPWEPR